MILMKILFVMIMLAVAGQASASSCLDLATKHLAFAEKEDGINGEQAEATMAIAYFDAAKANVSCASIQIPQEMAHDSEKTPGFEMSSGLLAVCAAVLIVAKRK